MNLNIQITHPLTGKIKLGILLFSGLKCKEFDPEVWQKIEELAQRYRQKYHSPAEAKNLFQPARKLYRSIGIEPTHTRPSSEALFRRIIKNKKLYQINSLVDTGNYCSLFYMLPIGLYDFARIDPPIVVRVGLEGEGYEGIRKDWVNLTGRILLADSKGAFGNPTSDSLRSSVSLGTSELLLIIFAPGNYPDEDLKSHIEFSETMYLNSHGGKLVEKGILY